MGNEMHEHKLYHILQERYGKKAVICLDKTDYNNKISINISIFHPGLDNVYGDITVIKINIQRQNKKTGDIDFKNYKIDDTYNTLNLIDVKSSNVTKDHEFFSQFLDLDWEV